MSNPNCRTTPRKERTSIAVGLTLEQYDIIYVKARKAGKKLAEYLRDLGLNTTEG